MKPLICRALAALAPLSVLAAEPAMPGAPAIESRMQALSREGQLQIPSERSLRQAAPSVPHVDALPRTGSVPLPDLGELVSRYERMPAGPAAAGLDAHGEGRGDEAVPLSGLLVFVSLGMPAPTLEALVVDAERARALLVLRGLKDRSLSATKLRIQQLIGPRKVAWRIDPTLYRSLSIQAVPTYVLVDPAQPLVQPCAAAQCGPVAHSRLAGDVTLQRALQTITDADPAFASAAQAYLRRLATVPGSAAP